MPKETIRIKGARANNLKNVSVEIPRDRLVVITGVSGSGKTSLAFDTLFAEGQRRFAQSLSSYARQFLGRMNKPDVDSIEGVPPAVAIEQKVNIRNPRSTVATTTEIYDYLRLVFARIGHTFSPVSGQEVHRDTVNTVTEYLSSLSPESGNAMILADLCWKDAGDKIELMLSLKEQGYSRLFADGMPVRIDDILASGAVPEEALLLVDRITLPGDKDRILSSVGDAFSRGEGRMSVWCDGTLRTFSEEFELDGMKFAVPDEYMFSFNSPLGACPVCGGFGKIVDISEELVVPDKSKSIYDGAIACWRGEKMGWFKNHLIEVSEKYSIPIFTPWCQLTDSERELVWEGDKSNVPDNERLIGIREFFDWVDTQKYKIQYKYMLSRFSGKTVCHSCHGSRLRPDALFVRVGGLNIDELLSMTVEDLLVWMKSLDLPESESELVKEPLDEIISRLSCLEDVGLGYLTLKRACNTLSGGESQRVNLVTALGSNLVGSMYILDEPSIGLHSRDTQRLISVLRRLVNLGNTVIVVEHDEEIIRAADLTIEMGPRAGLYGGEIIPEKDSLTSAYLQGRVKRYLRDKRNWQYSITVNGAQEHNLKNIDAEFPLGVLTVVTGVSGSGKSSLVGDILFPALKRHLDESGDLPGTFRGLSGNLDRIQRVEYVDQNPIGRSSRSNAATFLKAYDDIRDLLAMQQYAKINGYTAQYFSFNSDGGRCPECQGDGVVTIEMQFMADVTMVCEECGGKRFKPDVLEVRYRGKNIDEILNMSIDEAVEFFASGTEQEARSVVEKLKPLQDVGLGYLKLGQSSSTLSGGESQRIKLASYLSMSRNSRKQEKIMFIFDEPTTGLHFYDVEKLLKAFDQLLEMGHSLVVVEHNADVIRNADWIIDLGPDAGSRGGEIVFRGTPEDLKKNGKTLTAQWI